MDAQAEKHIVIEIDGWYLWDWKDADTHDWGTPYSIFHKCDGQSSYYVGKRNGTYKCNRCDHVAPDGIVAVHEFMNWEANGYGG